MHVHIKGDLWRVHNPLLLSTQGGNLFGVRAKEVQQRLQGHFHWKLKFLNHNIYCFVLHLIKERFSTIIFFNILLRNWWPKTISVMKKRLLKFLKRIEGILKRLPRLKMYTCSGVCHCRRYDQRANFFLNVNFILNCQDQSWRIALNLSLGWDRV